MPDLEQKLIHSNEVGMQYNAEHTVAIIGLGYIGLPLLIAFSEKIKVLGYDNNPNRIAELRNSVILSLNSDFSVSPLRLH